MTTRAQAEQLPKAFRPKSTKPRTQHEWRVVIQLLELIGESSSKERAWLLEQMVQSKLGHNSQG